MWPFQGPWLLLLFLASLITAQGHRAWIAYIITKSAVFELAAISLVGSVKFSKNMFLPLAPKRSSRWTRPRNVLRAHVLGQE